VSRTTIDQAIGVIMGQNRCDADAAFDVLRSASQHRNVKLRDVAARVIGSVQSAPPPPVA
jgi:AmiR/NasT family two-component response regulator